MKLSEYQNQGHSLTLVKGHSDFKVKCLTFGLYTQVSDSGPLGPLVKKGSFSYGRKYVHEVLVNRLGGLSLPRKSVVKLTDHPDMTLDVYRGRKTTIQQQQPV